MFEHPHMFGYPLYVWMPPVHTQNKESMLCQTKGVSIYTHTFGCPICLDASPVRLDAPMFGCPLYIWIPPYVWMPPACLDAPICLNTPLCLILQYVWTPPYVWMPSCMFGCPHMFGHPLYVWMLCVCLDDVGCSPVHTQHKESMLCHTNTPYFWMPPVCLNTPMFGHPSVCLDTPICLDDVGCLLYIHNTKKACIATLRGVHMPHTFGCPMFGCPPYVWMALCMFGCPHMCGHPLYVWICPYVWTSPVCLDNVGMPPVHTQHKESILCHTKGVSICPHTFGCPLYV